MPTLFVPQSCPASRHRRASTTSPPASTTTRHPENPHRFSLKSTNGAAREQAPGTESLSVPPLSRGIPGARRQAKTSAGATARGAGGTTDSRTAGEDSVRVDAGVQPGKSDAWMSRNVPAMRGIRRFTTKKSQRYTINSLPPGGGGNGEHTNDMPPPLAGGGQGVGETARIGDVDFNTSIRKSSFFSCEVTLGGSVVASNFPPTLALPRQGGGNGRAAVGFSLL